MTNLIKTIKNATEVAMPNGKKMNIVTYSFCWAVLIIGVVMLVDKCREAIDIKKKISELQDTLKGYDLDSFNEE